MSLTGLVPLNLGMGIVHTQLPRLRPSLLATIIHHERDLLQRQIFGLHDEEVCKDDEDKEDA